MSDKTKKDESPKPPKAKIKTEEEQPPEELETEPEETETVTEVEGEAEDEELSAEERVQQLQDELDELRGKLRRANRQAAERRIRLKKLAGKKEDKSEEVEEPATGALQSQLSSAQKELRRYKMTEKLEDVLDEMDVSFTSARARSDAVAFARDAIEREFVEDDDVPGDEDYQETLKKVLKGRPYLIRARKEPPAETDSKKRGKVPGFAISDDEEKAIAVQFGIKPM